MNEITYSGLRDDEKAEWGDGPWQDEPDKVQWQDEATDLPCLVVRNHWGTWCGYVGVPKEHPAYELDYDAVYKLFPDSDLSVHGGLTFADRCMEGPEDRSICHISAPGEPDDIWWFGFDCGHFMDLSPKMEAHNYRLYKETGDPLWLRPISAEFGPTYKDITYARAETTQLAAQLASLEYSRARRAWRWLRNDR